MSTHGAAHQSGIECRCGRWSHRAVRGFAFPRSLPRPAIGSFLFAEERHCPKCAGHGSRTRLGSDGAYLLVFRVHWQDGRVEAIGLAPLSSQDDNGVRIALWLLVSAHLLLSDEAEALAATVAASHALQPAA